MINKGINYKIIDEVLSKNNLDKLEAEQIKDLALKKYSLVKKREKDQKKMMQKLISFLISKGYSYELATEAVRQITKSDFIDYD